jgi:hypothetical protein
MERESLDEEHGEMPCHIHGPGEGFRVCVRNSFRKSVPEGRLKIGRDAILDNLQPSLRESIMFHGVPRTSVLGQTGPN